MRFLGIHYHFPPVKTVGSQRLFYFYSYLQPYDNIAGILTSSHHHSFRHDPALQLSDLALHFLPTYDLRSLGRSGGKAHLSNTLRQRSSVRALARLSQSFPFILLWGDGGLVYILGGYQKGKKLVQERGITHLFSSYRPYSDHAIAYLLKRKYPHLTWIADFRDLHVDPSRKNVYLPGLQRRFNHKILALADVVTTVSEGLAQSLKSFYPNVYILRNGIGELPAVQAEGMEWEKGNAPADDAFRITYTGSLYGELRSPAPLLEAVRRWEADRPADPMKLVYAGKDSRAWRAWTARYRLRADQEVHGLLDWQDARRLQQRSHLNLLLTWSTPESTGILTAKLFEYLQAGRPLLVLINGGPDPEFAELVEGSGVGRVFNTQQHGVEEVLAFLEELYRRWRATGSTAVAIPDEVLAPRRWAALMAGFVAFLEEEGNR